MVATYLVAARARSTLVLVHRQPLLDQWVAQLGMFLGLDPKAIGQIGAGKRRPTGRLDVAMLQSLVREGRVDDVVAGYGHVIVDECHHVPAVQGGMTPSERREVMAQLAGIPEDEPRLVLATGRYIGEGFDDARLDTLFLTMPVSWKGTLVQYAGRLHRLHPGKTEVRIYDYVDREVPLFQRMFEKRLRGYRAIGYARDDGLLNDDTGSGNRAVDDGTTETSPIPISRKTRRPRSGRRPRKTPPRTPAPW